MGLLKGISTLEVDAAIGKMKLFITVLEALSREFREGLPMELLYADDLVLMAEVVRLGRLWWFGHVEHKSGDDWVSGL